MKYRDAIMLQVAASCTFAVGIQESWSSRDDKYIANKYVVLASGAEKGVGHGCELWVSMSVVCGHLDGHPVQIAYNDVTALHLDPRR
eukprot:5580617-Karenia_brevis.AAC.1